MEEREERHNDEESVDENSSSHQNQTNILSQEEILASQNELAGKKLLGPHAAMGRCPMTFRYHLQRLTDQSALCRQWEDKLINTVAIAGNSVVANGGMATSVLKSQQDPTLFESRVFFSRSRSYPVMVASFIKYDAGEEKAKLEKMKADDQKGMEVFELPERDWRGFSYKPYFKQLSEERAGDFYYEKGLLYEPNSLDDPDLRYGCHRYVLQRSKNTGPILSSIITYVNKKDLKETLNEQFREKHPQLPPSLTLSKIRNCKKETMLFCVKIGLELSTVALAMINFERLCLKGIVTKYNRKLSMAVSLILAFKFHEDGFDSNKKKKYLLMDFFDKEWDLPPDDIFEAEFGALVHLGFLLHVPYQHLHVVYTRLLNMLNRTSTQYLGESMLETYHNDVKLYELEIEHIRQKKEREIAEAEEAALQEAAAVAAEVEAEQAKSSEGDHLMEEENNNPNGCQDEYERKLLDSGDADSADGRTNSSKVRRPTKLLSSLGMLYKQPSKIFRSQSVSNKSGNSSTVSTPARVSTHVNAVPPSTISGSATNGEQLFIQDPSQSFPSLINHNLTEPSVDGESSLGFLSSSGGVSPVGSVSSPMVPLNAHPFPLPPIPSMDIRDDEEDIPTTFSQADAETFSTATEPPLSFVPVDDTEDDVSETHSEPPKHLHTHHHHKHHHGHYHRRYTHGGHRSSFANSSSGKEVSFAPILVQEHDDGIAFINNAHDEPSYEPSNSSSAGDPMESLEEISNNDKQSKGGIVSSLFFRRRSRSNAAAAPSTSSNSVGEVEST
jgi:hypothetical protein